MSDLNISAPDAASPAPTTPAAAAEPAANPSADTAALSPQAETPAGTEDQQQNPEPDKPKDAEAARKQRNQERWQRMKQEAADSRRREAVLLTELERLQKQANPDYSKITDPDEMLAERTAAKLRSGQFEDTKARYQQETAVRAAAIDEAWSVIKDDMRAKAPDFDQVVTRDTPIHKNAAPFIVESEKGGEIAYWLGKNPDAARDLFNKFETAPAQAFIELGRIEARLSAPPPKQVSTAPKPAPTLNGGVSPKGFDIATASVADVAAHLKKSGVIR